MAPDEDLGREITRLTIQHASLVPRDYDSLSFPDEAGCDRASPSPRDRITDWCSDVPQRQFRSEGDDHGIMFDAQQYELRMEPFAWLNPRLQDLDPDGLYERIDLGWRRLTNLAGDLLGAEKFSEVEAMLRNPLQEFDGSPRLENCLFTLHARRILAQALFREGKANSHLDPSLAKVVEAHHILRRIIFLQQNAEGLLEKQIESVDTLVEECEETLARAGISFKLTATSAGSTYPRFQRLSTRTSENDELSPTSATWRASHRTEHHFASYSNGITSLASTTFDAQHESSSGACYDIDAETTICPPHQYDSMPAERVSSVWGTIRQSAELRSAIDIQSNGILIGLGSTAPNLDSTTGIGESSRLAIQLRVRNNPGG